MSDDSLLRELRRVAREDQELEKAELDGRWDAFAAGRLSTEEEEELRELAKESPEAAAAYEAFRPVGADFRARVVEAARFQLAGSRRSAARPLARPTQRAADGPRRQRWWLPSGALAAAALLLVVFWPRELPPLPPYGLELAGDVKTLRSSEAESPLERKVYVPGNRLRLVLMPSAAVDGPVTASAFVLAAGVPRRFDGPPAEVSEAGAVLIEGEVGREIELPFGDSYLLVVVGRSDSMPDVEELQSRLAVEASVHTAAWSAWKVPVRIREEAGP